jgi:hypothetical protein
MSKKLTKDELKKKLKYHKSRVKYYKSKLIQIEDSERKIGFKY